VRGATLGENSGRKKGGGEGAGNQEKYSIGRQRKNEVKNRRIKQKLRMGGKKMQRKPQLNGMEAMTRTTTSAAAGFNRKSRT